MDKENQLEVEKEYLNKLFKLRDFIWEYFDETDDIYNPLLRLAEEAIANKRTDIAILHGCKIVKNNRRKKYVFEVERLVGGVNVYINGEKITSFLDEVVKVENNDEIYTDIVKGMGSRLPDAVFVKTLLYCHADNECHLSDKVKAVLDRDIPPKILDELKKNIEEMAKNRRSDV